MHKRHLFLILILLVSSACGFHLRGSQSEMQEQIDGNIYLVEDQAGDIAAAVRSRLRTGGATLVPGPEQAEYTLTLANARTRRNVLSVSAQTGRAEEYQLTLSLEMSLAGAGGATLIEQQTIQLSRDYAFDQEAVLGAFSEEQVLQEEMLDQAAGQILQRLIAATRNNP